MRTFRVRVDIRGAVLNLSCILSRILEKITLIKRHSPVILSIHHLTELSTRASIRGGWIRSAEPTSLPRQLHHFLMY